MKTYNFIISYDISDKKRLRKVAKILEKEAMRFQYSLYIYYNVSDFQLKKLLQQIVNIIDEDNDDLRVYKINNFGLSFGNAIDLNNPLQIL